MTGLHLISNWDYRITCLLKLGLWDYTPFEIGIMGLQDPSNRALEIEAIEVIHLLQSSGL